MIRIPEYNYRCLTYYQRLFLIEALRKVNINDVSILTAYEYGKSSLAVWRDEPVLVNKFMQTNRAALINFNIERYIEVLNYIAKGLCEVEPDRQYLVCSKIISCHTIRPQYSQNQITIFFFH